MEEFNRLLKRYLQGQTSEEEDRQLEEWYRNQPETMFPDLSGKERESLEKKIWRSVDAGIREDDPPARRPLWPWLGGIAACIALAAGWFVSAGYESENALSELTAVTQKRFEIRNTTGSDQEIRLSDSTVILLKQNSSLVYEKDFNTSKREVYLSGEAFFRVKRDTIKPFIVYAGDLVTEVLGTSFMISQDKKSNTTKVAVVTGKVSVYTGNNESRSERNGVILTSNQQANYHNSSHYITTGIVEAPVPHVQADVVLPSLNFRLSPLQQVLDVLTQYYGIEFIIADHRIKECRINADLTGLSMFTQLELICKSIDATYEKRGTVIFISGDGC